MAAPAAGAAQAQQQAAVQTAAAAAAAVTRRVAARAAGVVGAVGVQGRALGVGWLLGLAANGAATCRSSSSSKLAEAM